MEFAIMVLGAPYTHQAVHSAIRFAEALPLAGHRLATAFFYHDGVYTASRLLAPPQDEPHLTKRWQAIAHTQGTQLQVCIAAALRRGIVDEGEAKRHSLPSANLADGFMLTGLSEWLVAAQQCDRTITFAP